MTDKNTKSIIIKFLLLIIIITSILVRRYGANWDLGYHFHPDERMIIMTALNINWVNPITDWDSFYSIKSPMNPNFFAYGSLPIYLLALSGWIFSFIDPQINTYDGLLVVGRYLSTIFDIITIVFIYLIAKIFIKNIFSVLAPLTYSISVFTVQSAHFFTVDPILTCFLTGFIYTIISWRSTNKKKYLYLSSILLGLAIGTKFSALISLSVVGIVILESIYKLISDRHSKSIFPELIKLKLQVIIFLSVTAITLSIVQPYMWIDFEDFTRSIQEQTRMRYDAWTFPYTRQYVQTLPYIYHLEQIIRWGWGWIPGVLIVTSVLYSFIISLKTTHLRIMMIFIIIYFGFFGMFAVKFMRYMLPIYPLFAVTLAILFAHLWNRFPKLTILIVIINFSWQITWLVAFLNIYSHPPTRVKASQWIANNIPPNSQIAIEHWDDAIPVPPYHSNFQQTSLALYDLSSDSPISGTPKHKSHLIQNQTDKFPSKWIQISSQLSSSDLIVVASNRLYSPLTKLTDNYPVASRYYELLFNEQLGYKLVHTESITPQIGSWLINDQVADESFHVYDHPKIMIFKNTQYYTQTQLFDIIWNNSI